jgi:ATP-binding cassette subfamily F protein 3
MPQLNIFGVSIAYGSSLVLEDVAFTLEPGEKAGLIGPNGSGKTTLLKIISGDLKPDSGSVHLARGTTVGYLPQLPQLSYAGTLWEYLEKSLRRLFHLKDEIAGLERQMAVCSKEADPDQMAALLDKYGKAVSLYEAGEGYSAENRIRAVALGLGFKPGDLDGDLRRFSGGEKTRARLGALLLQQPDLLLLDEPTNFLDLDGVEWLERYLRESNLTIITVSHDRYFLDRVAARIFSLHQCRLKSYNGNYSAYLALRESERKEAERAYFRQQALVDKEERLIRESKIDQRSKRQARSRQKRLDKLEMVERPGQDKTFNLDLDYSGRSGSRVICFDRVCKSFGNRELFTDLSFELNRGERVALIGPNGVGKSTLLKLITAEELPDSGSVRLGAAVRVTYFSQEQEQLLPERTLLEEITASSDLDLRQARHHLGVYLFRGDDVFKQVKHLSGGEKCRLALARLALSGGNLLLMDEPTSHLDLLAVEELEKTLSAYPGTLIVVSHDRFFLRSLVNRVIELGRAGYRVYNGGFQEFLEQRADREEGVFPERPGVENRKALKQERINEHRRRQEQLRRVRQLRDELYNLEEKIALSESAVDQLEKELSSPDCCGNYIRLVELTNDLEDKKAQLSVFLKRWEEISLDLEKISAEGV